MYANYLPLQYHVPQFPRTFQDSPVVTIPIPVIGAVEPAVAVPLARDPGAVAEDQRQWVAFLTSLEPFSTPCTTPMDHCTHSKRASTASFQNLCS